MNIEHRTSNIELPTPNIERDIMTGQLQTTNKMMATPISWGQLSFPVNSLLAKDTALKPLEK